MERNGAVTFQGNPLTLVGSEVTKGMKAPEFTLLKNDLTEAGLSDFKGKVLIIAAVPSLDTHVCEMETKRFDEEVARLGDNVQLLVVSMDLPFAQARWIKDAGVKNVVALSDHRYADFGMGYGVLIKELRLLARSVFIVDTEGVVRYTQLVREVGNEPDYNEVLDAAKKLA
ncbi:MAG: thiol peroxidase [Desulfatibacillaceae bacterium]